MLSKRLAALALAGSLLANSGCFGMMDRCCHNNTGIGNGQLVGRMFGQNQGAVAPAYSVAPAYAGAMPIHTGITGMPGGSGDCSCGGHGDGVYQPVGLSHGAAPHGVPMMMSPEMGMPSGPPSGMPIQMLPSTTTPPAPQNNPGPRITPVPMTQPGVGPAGYAPQSPWNGNP